MNRRGVKGLVLCFAVLWLGFASVSAAQTVAVAQLSGIVTDESAGALPGAEVTVTQTGTGMTRFVITGALGDYVFPGLPVGPYKVTAKMSGFSVFEQSGIVLQVGDTRSVNIVLKLGAMSETISVVADANLVETRSLAAGVVVDQEQIVSLPLNGRDATQLVLLAGGAVPSNLDSGDRQPAGAVSISVAGALGNSTMYLVDGGYNNDPQNNSGNAIPFPDALQEFRAEAGVRDARFGMSSGATVNAVTKSGTNVFHGNAFEFMRDHTFNSIRWAERSENGGFGRDDGLHRDQFGGTLGGPILRDRLFFFGGTQITKTQIEPLVNDLILPTAEVLAGDFRRVMAPPCRTSAATLGAPFVNNQVNPALFHPISLKIMAMLPKVDPAMDPSGCGRFSIRLPNDQTDQQYVGRMDFQVTPTKRVFFRDFIALNKHPSAWNKDRPNLLETQGVGRGTEGLQHTIATGLDYVVSSRLFSSTRFSYQHTKAVRQHNEGVPTWSTLGVNAWAYTIGNIPGQEFLGGGPWASAITGIFFVDTPQISQDFDWTFGSHSLSFGGSWARPASNGDGTANANGIMTMSGLYTSSTNQATGGLNLADFVLGYVASYQGSGTQLNDVWVNSPGFYVNDVWRVNRRVTLNYGLRWEPFFSVKDANGFNIAFRRENYVQGIRSTVRPNAPLGLIFAGDAEFPNDGGNTNDKLMQLSPRFGVVWDPGGDNRQTVRAGAGLYFDSPKTWSTAGIPLNPPFGQRVLAVHPTSCPGKPVKLGECPVDLADPWNATPGGDPQVVLAHQGEPYRLPPITTPFPENASYRSLPLEVEPTESYQFNLSYQRQLAARMLVDVTYTGSITRHIFTGFNENPVVYIPGNCQAGQYALTAAGPCSNTAAANQRARQILTLLNPDAGRFYNNDLQQAFTGASGHYNGLKFTLTKRLSNNWSANGNYTISRCINEGEPGTNIANTFPVSLIDPFNNPYPDVTSNEGPCSADRRHLFNLSAIAVSPGVGSGVVNAITKDWQVGFIFVTRSGAPINVTQANDNALVGGTQWGIVVPGVDPYLPEEERTFATLASAPSMAWFNLNAFKVNGPGEIGPSMRGYLVGPGYWNADLAFSRNLEFGSGRRFEIRVEAFNLFDTLNWNNPTVQVGSTNVNNGRVTNTVGDPRIMQFALKYSF